MYSPPFILEIMKKIVLSIVAAVVALSASAQSSFTPGWNLGLKGGAAYTAGETVFKNLVSPSAALDLGYQFTPVFGLRGDLSGWQAKAYLPAYSEGYKFNYGQLALDGTFDLRSLFSGYAERVFNPYALIGVGANLAFNNDEANDLASKMPKENYLWDGKKLSPDVRAGIGADFNITRSFALTAEVVTNILTDKFNSKHGDKSHMDYQTQGLVGIKFFFGRDKAAPVAAAAAPVAAAAATQPEPAPQPAPQPRPQPQPKPQVVEAPAKINVVENIFFDINKSVIKDSEKGKIDNIVKVLKENPDTKITLVGHADKATGNTGINDRLSKERAAAVQNALVNMGIASDRISSDYKGDTANPFSTPEENRVVICVVE